MGHYFGWVGMSRGGWGNILGGWVGWKNIFGGWGLVGVGALFDNTQK